MRSSTIAPGIELGRYQLSRHLATGGMADVWLADMSGPGGFRKRVVVKTLRSELHGDPPAIEMFVQEARLAARLSHPNIVQIFDFGEVHGTYFIAMEYVPGINLRQIHRAMRDQKRLAPIAFVVAALVSVCDALSYAHTYADDDGRPLGLVHRDVTPDNVMVTFGGVAKVLDFGIAKSIDEPCETEAGMLKGKYAYVAPEQILGTPVDGRTDLYSVGIIAYEMLTGRRPFQDSSSFKIMQKVIKEAPQPLRRLAPWVPEALEAIVLRCLEKSRDARYASALELAHALERVQQELGGKPSRRAVADFVRALSEVMPRAQQPKSIVRPATGAAPRSPQRPAPTKAEHPEPDISEIDVDLSEEEHENVHAGPNLGRPPSPPARATASAVAGSASAVRDKAVVPRGGPTDTCNAATQAVDDGWTAEGVSSGFDWEMPELCSRVDQVIDVPGPVSTRLGSEPSGTATAVPPASSARGERAAPVEWTVTARSRLDEPWPESVKIKVMSSQPAVSVVRSDSELPVGQVAPPKAAGEATPAVVAEPTRVLSAARPEAPPGQAPGSDASPERGAAWDALVARARLATREEVAKLFDSRASSRAATSSRPGAEEPGGAETGAEVGGARDVQRPRRQGAEPYERAPSERPGQNPAPAPAPAPAPTPAAAAGPERDSASGRVPGSERTREGGGRSSGPTSPWDRAARTRDPGRGERRKSGFSDWPVSHRGERAPRENRSMDNASLAAEAFERGLSSFRRKQYDAARVAWEEAVRLAPEERRYSVNLEKLRRLLKEQR